MISFFVLARPVFADCRPIYGGGQTCTNAVLSITKSVLNPSTNTFVHDMGINDPRFSPGGQVAFQLTVTNMGTDTAHGVNVFDVLPQFVVSSSPSVNTTSGTTIEWNVGDLAPNQSQTVAVTATIAPLQNFPSNELVVCQNNQAQASDSSGHFSEDSSQFCIQTTGITVITPQATIVPTVTVFPAPSPTTLPPTGTNPMSFLFIFSTSAAGITLKYFEKRFFMKKNSVVSR